MKKHKRDLDKINVRPTGGTSHIVPPRDLSGVLEIEDRKTVTYPTPTTCGLHGDHDRLRFEIRPRGK